MPGEDESLRGLTRGGEVALEEEEVGAEAGHGWIVRGEVDMNLARKTVDLA